MTNVRTGNRSNTSSAQSPSPIATAKGLKSSAINDEILSEYIEKTIHVPDLSLPESYFPIKNHHHRSIPVEIDLSSLLSGDDDSVRQFLESVTEFGVFRLIGHGISDDELQSIVAEIELVLGVSNVKRERDRRRLKRASREEFFWFRSGKGTSETIRDEIGSERYRYFRKKMDDIYNRLEGIAGSVGQILLNYMKEPQEKGFRMREPVLCCYRYNPDNDNDVEHDEQVKKNVHTFDHALSLYVSIGNQEFHVKTGKGSLSFNTCSGSIVGTIRRLEEWSQGEFKRVQSEPMLKRDMDESPSYSIEFMFTPSSLNYSSPTNIQRDDTKFIISLFDQFVVALVIAFLYSFLTYIL